MPGTLRASSRCSTLPTSSKACSEEESGCIRLWVWMDDATKLRTRGIMRLEEPRERDSPDMHYPDIGMFDDVPLRWGQVKLLAHNVLIHLDRVIYFTRRSSSSPESFGSDGSDVSGLPSEISSTPPWLMHWGYRWYLCYEASEFPPPPPRTSAHSRLRFPDAGGDDGAGSG
ncbi:hypothetical protein VPH35_113771 [Triticum aestivum]